jgi:hypothetical protein
VSQQDRIKRHNNNTHTPAINSEQHTTTNDFQSKSRQSCESTRFTSTNPTNCRVCAGVRCARTNRNTHFVREALRDVRTRKPRPEAAWHCTTQTTLHVVICPNACCPAATSFAYVRDGIMRSCVSGCFDSKQRPAVYRQGTFCQISPT